MKVDPAALRKLFESQPDVFQSIAEKAKTVGALHHRFLAGEDQVLIVDEWESAEAFQEFFSSEQEIAALMAEAGVKAPPEIQVWQPMTDAPDTF
jgi:heme-degrading monooxygenase HmoA